MISSYPRYRASGLPSLGEIPEHWAVRRLSGIFQLIGSGATPNTDTPRYYDGGDIPWVNTGDLNDGHLHDCERRITNEALRSHSALKVFPADSVVIAMYGATIGKLALLKIAATVNQACCVFGGRSEVQPQFLLYTLMALRAHIISLAYGGGQPNISQQTLRSLRIPKPPLSEQSAIAAFLDRETAKIDALVAEQQRLIELLKEKRQAVISHAVTKGLNSNAPMKDSGIDWPTIVPAHWEVLPLTRVVSQFVDYRGKTPTKIDNGVPLITATQIKRGRIDHSLDPVFISEEEYAERMTRGYPEKGDVIITTEAPLGEAAQIDDERVALGQRIILMKPNKGKITASFLFTHFRSQFGHNELWKRASGSTASGIRADRLKASAVLVPPLNEQLAIVNLIAETVSRFSPIENAIHQQIEILQERRSALISAAVTGKIDVRGTAQVELAVA